MFHPVSDAIRPCVGRTNATPAALLLSHEASPRHDDHVIGGALAQSFEGVELSVLLRWAWPGATGEAAVVGFTRYQFLSVISAALGFYVLHRLSRIHEGEEISERVVIQQLALETVRTVNQVSTVAGLLGNLFTFGRLSERRMQARRSAREATVNAAGAGNPSEAENRRRRDDQPDDALR